MKDIEDLRASHGRDVAVLPSQDIESIIASSGFETPVLLLQTVTGADSWAIRLGRLAGRGLAAAGR